MSSTATLIRDTWSMESAEIKNTSSPPRRIFVSTYFQLDRHRQRGPENSPNRQFQVERKFHTLKLLSWLGFLPLRAA
jgi:hypothetical protein